jgi:hypothetical protein
MAEESTFIFTQKSKSDLGWNYIAVIETGRYKEPLPTVGAPDFWQQVDNCQSQIMDGPQHFMRWGVPDGTRDSITGNLVHDDLLISSALCAVQDEQDWTVTAAPLIVKR